MLKFKPLRLSDGAKLRRYYSRCSYGLCEYSAGTKLMPDATTRRRDPCTRSP